MDSLASSRRAKADVRAAGPWRALGWCAQAGVCGGVVYGMASALVMPVVTGTWDPRTLGGALLIVLFILLFALTCVLCAAWQRRAVRILRRPAIAVPPGLGPTVPVSRRLTWWLRIMFRGGGFVRDLAYCVLFVPVAAAAVAVAFAPLTAILAIGVLVVAAVLRLPERYGVDLNSLWHVLVVAALLTVCSPWLVGRVAQVGEWLARAVMDPGGRHGRSRDAALDASRRRLTNAFESERKRIERDLHDGAQQRIIAQSMILGTALMELEDLGDEVEPARTLVRQAGEENRRILTELRDLVRAIHPRVLTERGLSAALNEVLSRTEMTVHADVDLQRRAPDLVESTAYFVVLETLANTAKHAGTTAVEVRIRLTGLALSILVIDNGRGGATVTEGGGLAGLMDRVEAIGGRLTVFSPLGGPTLVRTELPLFPRTGSEAAMSQGEEP